MNDYILNIKDLHKSFMKARQKIEVLVNFNIEIAKGEFVVIVGPSGSGKSTLLHILGGLDTPDSGLLLYNNQNIFGKNNNMDNYRKHVVGFVFQHHYLMPDFTILENVMIPAMVAGLGDKEAKEKAYKVIEFLGLSDRIEHYPAECSGGEGQRAAICRALINNPEIILADEPTGNLDRKNSDNVLNIFLNENKRGTTIIVATHDENIANCADKVVHLEKR
ncbi:MAG: ABC transporter ATP-binding protein [Deferribacterota bacterium]|nr:ABC transporter ATP-binding protein [Deferribacterota bacterium]